MVRRRPPARRVEDEDPQRCRALRGYLGKKGIPQTEIASERRGQFVLRPRSGLGQDALRIANEITEQVHPELSQVRLLRVTPRPGVKGR